MKKLLKLDYIRLGNVVRICDPISGCSVELKGDKGKHVGV